MVASMFLSRAIAFLVTPLYYKQLTIKAIAELETLTIIMTLAAVLAGLELSQAIARFFPKHMNDSLSRGNYFSIVRINILATLTLTCTGLIAAISIPEVNHKHLLAILSGCITLALCSLTQSYLRSTFMDIELIRFNFVLAILILLFTTAFYQLRFLSPITFISIPAGATILALAYTIKPSFRELLKAPRLDTEKALEYFKFSLPLLLVAAINLGYFYSDRLYLIHSLSSYHLAVYSLGIKFTTITTYIYIAAGIIITPRIMRRGDGEYSVSLITKSVYLCCAVIFSGLVFSEFFGNFIVLTLSTSNYLEVAEYIACFIAIATFTSSYVFMSGVDFEKKTYLHIIPYIAATATFIVVALIITPKNIVEIILVKLISAFVLFIAQFLINARYTTPSTSLFIFNSILFVYSINKTI